MKNTEKFWILWAAAYVLCTVCAFFPVNSVALFVVFLLLSLGFFVPPGCLIYAAVQEKKPKILRSIRNLSLISLFLTLVMILLNFASIQASAEWGLALYWLLILVSTPAVCSQVWIISLFGWAVLLMTCLKFLIENKKATR